MLEIDDAGAAINYAVNNGAKVINMSWGMTQESKYLKEIISYANAAGVVLVAAAGNDNSADKFYPADYPEVIAVAATDENDRKAQFSNYNSRISVCAPGVSIISTMLNKQYVSWSGTSMASPFVAGLAALVIIEHPDWTSEQVKESLIKTVDKIDGKNHEYLGNLGSGRIKKNWITFFRGTYQVADTQIAMLFSGTHLVIDSVEKKDAFDLLKSK